MMGQTNNYCRFRISTLTSSLRQQPLLAGREGSRPRYVLVHNFLRRRCNGSKKWSWLIQWMKKRISSSIRGISMPNFELLDALIALALNEITKSSISPISKEESVWKKKKPRSETVSFAAERLLT